MGRESELCHEKFLGSPSPHEDQTHHNICLLYYYLYSSGSSVLLAPPRPRSPPPETRRLKTYPFLFIVLVS